MVKERKKNRKRDMEYENYLGNRRGKVIRRDRKRDKESQKEREITERTERERENREDRHRQAKQR